MSGSTKAESAFFQSPKNHFNYQRMASLPCAAAIAHMLLLLHLSHLLCIHAKLHATLWYHRVMFFWKSFLASSLDVGVVLGGNIAIHS